MLFFPPEDKAYQIAISPIVSSFKLTIDTQEYMCRAYWFDPQWKFLLTKQYVEMIEVYYEINP